jgi:hypothetical protein
MFGRWQEQRLWLCPWRRRGVTNWVIIEHRLLVVSQLEKRIFWHLPADNEVGHCRRRKIRCLLAPEDPQGKCQNCIRLKKDCNFFPVEQHQESDQRPPSESKLDALSSEAGTSDSSSPSFTGNRGPEHFDHPNPRLKHLPTSAAHQDVRVVDTLSRSLTSPPTTGKSGGLVRA